MRYPEAERGEVFRRALIGLFQLASIALFEKYVDFIDTYAGLPDEEREDIFREMAAEEELPVITFKQFFTEKGIQQGEMRAISRMVAKKFNVSPETVMGELEPLPSATIRDLEDRVFEWDSFDQLQAWLEKQHRGPSA